MAKLLKRAFRKLAARPMLQEIWERLYRLSLIGMNVDVPTIGNSGELQVIDLLHEVHRPLVVFDVGAHTGRYAHHAAGRLGARARIYCFEPSAEAFTQLARSCDQDQRIRSFNVGFGDKDEMATLFANADGSEIGSVFNRRLDHFGVRMTHTESVRLRTLDSFCQEEGIDQIDLLKLDVEGNELRVLAGAQRLLQRPSIGFIQIEFGGCNIDSRTYLQDFFYLLNKDYALYRILQSGFAPITQYREKYELFLTTNFLAVRNDLKSLVS